VSFDTLEWVTSIARDDMGTLHWIGVSAAVLAIAACTQDFDAFFRGQGSGGTGGTGGTGGSVGGSGGDGGCSEPADCPGGDTTCRYRTCDNDVCGAENAAEGTACAEQGGQTCDGSGNCVECLTNEDCPDDEDCDGTGTCVDDGCADSQQNGSETDVDCGGSVCPTCPNGSTCSSGTDCTSGMCADGLCCDVACDGPCEACNSSGSDGSCTPHPKGSDPESDCSGAEICDGAGACMPPCGANSCTDDAGCTPTATSGACSEVADDCLTSACVGASPGGPIESGVPTATDFTQWQSDDDETARGGQRWYCNATLPVTSAGVLTDWELFVDNNGANNEVAQLLVLRCTGGGGGTGPVLTGCTRVGIGPAQTITGDGLASFTLAGSNQLDGATADNTGIVVQAGDTICADSDRYDIGVDCNGQAATQGCPGLEFDTQFLAGLDVMGEPLTLENSPSDGVLMIKAWGAGPATLGSCSDTETEVDTTLCSVGGDTCCSGACVTGPSGAGTCS
jgi:hypothetical protein